jgi:hypothetical protein
MNAMMDTVADEPTGFDGMRTGMPGEGGSSVMVEPEAPRTIVLGAAAAIARLDCDSMPPEINVDAMGTVTVQGAAFLPLDHSKELCLLCGLARTDTLDDAEQIEIVDDVNMALHTAWTTSLDTSDMQTAARNVSRLAGNILSHDTGIPLSAVFCQLAGLPIGATAEQWVQHVFDDYNAVPSFEEIGQAVLSPACVVRHFARTPDLVRHEKLQTTADLMRYAGNAVVSHTGEINPVACKAYLDLLKAHNSMIATAAPTTGNRQRRSTRFA